MVKWTQIWAFLTLLTNIQKIGHKFYQLALPFRHFEYAVIDTWLVTHGYGAQKYWLLGPIWSKIDSFIFNPGKWSFHIWIWFSNHILALKLTNDSVRMFFFYIFTIFLLFGPKKEQKRRIKSMIKHIFFIWFHYSFTCLMENCLVISINSVTTKSLIFCII